MSVAAVMLVRDEVDIVAVTVRHLLAQDIDHVYVADNRSADGTFELLADLEDEFVGAVTVSRDDVVGYWQSRKTTALARVALGDGHGWVVPCDADELWVAPSGWTVGNYLAGQGPDVQIVTAAILNHVASVLDDPDDPDPTTRIGWRLPSSGVLPKVACRLAADLTIEAGNHGASYAGDQHVLAVGGLTIHHYSWRTEAQYVLKIRNGLEAYQATDLPDTTGAHWRMFAGATDEGIAAHYHKWFSLDPSVRTDLVYDPLR